MCCHLSPNAQRAHVPAQHRKKEAIQRQRLSCHYDGMAISPLAIASSLSKTTAGWSLSPECWNSFVIHSRAVPPPSGPSICEVRSEKSRST